MSRSVGVSRRRFLTSGTASAVAAAVGSQGVRARSDDEDASPSSEDSVARVHATPAQTIQGFGASGAWWPNDLIRFDSDVPASWSRHRKNTSCTHERSR
jgi:hypothetical protein